MTRPNLLVLALAGAALLSQPAYAQPGPSDYRAPRTSFGDPSLEGVWTQNFVILMEASPQAPMLVLPEAAARQMAEAAANGMDGLAGHRSTGGIRASMYNAMPVAGAKALADFMRDFARRKG